MDNIAMFDHELSQFIVQVPFFLKRMGVENIMNVRERNGDIINQTYQLHN